MNTQSDPSAGETAERYSLEVIARLAGVDTRTVIRYQERGLLRSCSASQRRRPVFDSECLRQLRLIEHLRGAFAVNDSGLELILGLLHEVECLRQERRQLLR
jgi:DNA-binding transcriptional MerR regulator